MTRPEEEREKWLAGCSNENYEMKLKKAWALIRINKIPKERRILRNKWLFKLKRDDTYRSRLVTMGFSQAFGVDFTDSFAPVVGDVTVRVLLVLKNNLWVRDQNGRRRASFPIWYSRQRNITWEFPKVWRAHKELASNY